MKELLEYIVKSLASNPEAVQVTEENTEGNINLKLKVDPKDMGMIIGKSGQTIKAIRRLLTARCMAEYPNSKVYVNLEE